MRKVDRTQKIRCISCHKEVEVKMVTYGNGYIAVCPECKKLAYNGK